jgi:hypothetical protein
LGSAAFVQQCRANRKLLNYNHFKEYHQSINEINYRNKMPIKA